MQFLKVFSETLELLVGKLMTTGCTKKSGKSPLENDVVREIRRQLLSLECGLVQEVCFLGVFQAKEFRQLLK
jgi:hypothetical protein